MGQLILWTAVEQSRWPNQDKEKRIRVKKRKKEMDIVLLDTIFGIAG